MLQSASEGGSFYQAPLIKADATYGSALDAFAQTEFWGVTRDDVTFIFFSGAAVLENVGANANLLFQDGYAMPMDEFVQMVRAVPGTKIVALNLVYPSERIKRTGLTEKEIVKMLNDVTLRAFESAQPGGRDDVYALCFTSSSNMLEVISSIKNTPFGLAPYFLSQACGYDYQNERPCELFADVNQDGAVSLEEARAFVSAKTSEFLNSGGLSDLSLNIASHPQSAEFPIFARRQRTQITRVEMSQHAAECPTDKNMRLSATLFPPNASDKTIIWSSSDLSVATVDELGVVTALRAGDVVIAASASNGLSDFCALKVRTVKYVESMKFNMENAALFTDGTLELKLNLVPENANEPLLYQSSDESVATVSQAGLVTAMGVGRTEITASTDGETPVVAKCSVTVAQRGQLVERVELKQPLLSMFEGSQAKMEARVLPQGADDPLLLWASDDEDVATVTEDGVVTAVAKGSCVITATASSGAVAEVQLTVRAAVIEFKNQDFSVQTGDSAKIDYRFIPEGTKATVEWASANEKIATVSKDGVVTGVTPGETEIIATTSTGGRGVQAVTVTEVRIDSIKLIKDKLRLMPGQEEQLEVDVKPATEKGQPLAWSSGNPQVATVDENGRVFALADGKAEITVLAKSGKTAACRIEVKTVKVQKVTLDQSTLSLVLIDGLDSAKLTATTTPENAMLSGVQWASDNEKVARVSDDGVVTAVAEGKAVIRAASQDGNARAMCKVMVLPNRVAYDQPLSGSEAKLYVSAKRIYYDRAGNLVAEMYFLNKSKETLHLPKMGTLYLQWSDGKELAALNVLPGNKQLKPGKLGALTFEIPIAQTGDDQRRGLDLRAVQATIRTAEEDEALRKLRASQTPAPTVASTVAPAAEATAAPERPDEPSDFVEDLE
jgi:uncharacterized protein YjdB